MVEAYIRTGLPVGSKSIAGACEVSSATVRNAMAELEEQGLLSRSHVSAGAVPTEDGYRTYVAELLACRIDRSRLSSESEAGVDSVLGAAVLSRADDLTELLHETSRALSSLSRCVGLVLARQLGDERLRAIQFLRVGPQRIVAVVVGDDGVVHDRVFRVAGDYAQDELDRISNYISNRFAGSTLEEVQRIVDAELHQARAAYDSAMRQMLSVALLCLDTCVGRAELYVDGAAVCVAAAEFDDVERVQQLLAAFEQKDRMAALLSGCLEREGVHVRIGTDTAVATGESRGIDGLAFVAAQFGDGAGTRGSVGVVGPMRMRYDRIINIVEGAAREVGSAIRAVH